jgi:hypothetical protein
MDWRNADTWPAFSRTRAIVSDRVMAVIVVTDGDSKRDDRRRLAARRAEQAPEGRDLVGEGELEAAEGALGLRDLAPGEPGARVLQADAEHGEVLDWSLVQRDRKGLLLGAEAFGGAMGVVSAQGRSPEVIMGRALRGRRIPVRVVGEASRVVGLAKIHKSRGR